MVAEKITTVCRNTIFITVRQKREKGKGGKRAPRVNPTPEKVQEVNQRIAERELSMRMNYNLRGGDLHIVLTYANIPNNEEAHKALDKFIRACRKEMKKLGLIFKAVTATEYKHSRIHHHVVCNFRDIETVTRLWKKGNVKVAVLDDSGDYRRLAAYIIKETSKTFRDPDAFSKRRYNCTRSMVMPVSRIEEVSAAQLVEDPKAIKDYYVDKDSVYHGMNPFTERPYVEYVMIANDAAAPRLETWKRGKPLKRRVSTYSKWLKENMPKQEEMVM